MDNSAALRKGTAKARKIIDDHIYLILTNIAKKLLQDATNGRIFLGHNMTGNTVNSYAVGVYKRGVLDFMMTSSQGIPKPLRRKLGYHQRFYAGDQRWDGETQQHTFTAQVGTNGSTEAERSIAFIQSYQASPKGWTIVLCNGVEYASFQESMMDIDVLTANFDAAKMLLPAFFKPIPD